MYLFNFQRLIKKLRNNPEKAEIVKKYEQKVESLEGKDVYDLRFYKDYLDKIMHYPYQIPEASEELFDWTLLIKLVVGSYSSEYSIEESKNESEYPDLLIHVKMKDISITRKISELCDFQIFRLYEIYVEELMNLEALRAEEESEKNEIQKIRMLRLEAWKKYISDLDKKFENNIKNSNQSEIDKLFGI